MRMFRLQGFCVVLLGSALVATGCGQNSPTLSPTGPTGLVSGVNGTAGVSDSSGMDSVSVLDKGKGGGKRESSSEGDLESESEHGRSGDDKGKPEKGTRGVLSGFVTAVDGTSLTVRGVTVTPAEGAVIRHGSRILLLADIIVGDHVQARGTMVAGVLVANEIKVEQGGDDDEEESSEEETGKVEGVVAGLPGPTPCPTLAFTVGTTQVTTSSTTTYEGVTCETLANDLEIEVTGVLQLDNSIAASKIEVK